MAKITKTSFVESEGVSILKLKLESTGNIKTSFYTDDKKPIYDGPFCLLKNEEILRQYESQIKSTDSPKYDKKGILKYSFEMSFLKDLKNNISLNPTFIFVVDIKNKKIFYKYINNDFLKGINWNNKSACIVSFFQNDELNDIKKFELKLKQLNYQIKINNPILSSEEIKIINLAISDFNKKLDKIEFIKDYLFPKLWNFGLSFETNYDFSNDVAEKYSSSCSSFSIYPRKLEENATSYRRFDDKALDNIFINKTYGVKISPNKYLDNCLAKILHYYFQNTYGYFEFFPEIILRELIFFHLDEIAKYNDEFCDKDLFATFYTDSISLKDAKQIIIKYIHIFSCKEKVITLLSVIEKKGINKIDRVWNYKNNKMLVGGYSISRYCEEKIVKAYDELMSNFPKILDDVIDSLPIKISYKYKGEYHYSFELVDNCAFPFYETIVGTTTNINSNLKFIKKESILLDFNSKISEVNYVEICKGIFGEEIMNSGTPFLSLVLIHVYSLLCSELCVENKGLVINSMTMRPMITARK